MPPKPRRVAIVFAQRSDGKKEPIPYEWRSAIAHLQADVRYLLESLNYLTASLENPVCPHCNGTGEVEGPEIAEVQR